MNEIWRDIVGWEQRYMVSNLGRYARFMKLSPHRAGYLKVCLREDRVSKTVTVHTLVGDAFLGPRPEDHQVNHRDGDKANNCVSNLEYLNRSQHEAHTSALGLRPFGNNVSTAKLTPEQVIAIREDYARGNITFTELAKIYGVAKGNIARIVRLQTWRRLKDSAPAAKTDITLTEIWLPVGGWKTYLVSNHGRVAHISTPSPRPDGYIRAMLSEGAVRQHIFMQRMVAQAFLPNYADHLQVNHIDGNKSNNALSNLECIARKPHAHKTFMRLGYHPGNAGNNGAENSMAKLTDDSVRRIREMHATGSYTYQELANLHGVTKQAVWFIVKRKTWLHIG